MIKKAENSGKKIIDSEQEELEKDIFEIKQMAKEFFS